MKEEWERKLEQKLGREAEREPDCLEVGPSRTDRRRVVCE